METKHTAKSVPDERTTRKRSGDAMSDSASDKLLQDGESEQEQERERDSDADVSSTSSTRRESLSGSEVRHRPKPKVSDDSWPAMPHGDPLAEIMNDAHLPTCPAYIFKAHEMTQEVRDLLKHCPDTDVVLEAQDGELPAHTVVLYERGGNLAQLVRDAHVGDRVRVDLGEDELREVLRFVYTGCAPATARIPRQLLVAAHLLGLQGLKERCGEELVAHLSVDNVVEMFDLADTHKEERLKLAAAVLFLENSKQVYDTQGWHLALERRPASAMRLVQIAVASGNMKLNSVRASTRIVHVLAKLYMAAVVPVMGYIIYATVKARKLQAGAEADNSTVLDSDILD